MFLSFPFIVIDVKTEYKVKVEKEEEDPSKGLLEIIENSSNSYVLLQVHMHFAVPILMYFCRCTCTLYHLVAIDITVAHSRIDYSFHPACQA